MLFDEDLEPRGKSMDWSNLLESSKIIAVEEIRKEISKILLEFRNQNKIDFEIWEALEKESQSTAEKIFNRVIKTETDLAIYGEAMLKLE